MTSRVFAVLAPAVLLSLAAVSGASCGSTSRPIAPPPDGGFGGGGSGGGTTSSTHSTTTSTTSTTSTTGSTTSATTSTGAGGDGGPPVCVMDAMKDGSETDVDCGGGCKPCGGSKHCAVGTDCLSGTCTAGTCTDSCKDMMTDGNETDVDCGGSCPPCGDTLACQMGADCQSKVCANSQCQAPTCSDSQKNQDETDVDCGGTHCNKCSFMAACLVDGDCQSGSCKNSICQAATCSDHIRNNDETDVDCGGTTCQPCTPGLMCAVASDCDSKVCDPTTHKCAAPSCNDLVQNGSETDIDCGGTCSHKCNPGQKCLQSADCVGAFCQTTCQCPLGMLVVPIQGSGIYCIDATEVTYSQYLSFYNANPPTASQPTYCGSWNVTYTPANDWPPAPTATNDPVRYVNWCQADAYCRYNGKRLCGQIGGGHVSAAAFANIAQDQWYNACTAQGLNPYPYGKNYVAGVCNGGGSSDGGTAGPESYLLLPNCAGGEPGLLEMSGNVAEWEDSCDNYNGQADQCSVRGGSFSDDSQGLRCGSGRSTPLTHARTYQGQDVGFRCCL